MIALVDTSTSRAASDQRQTPAAGCKRQGGARRRDTLRRIWGHTVGKIILIVSLIGAGMYGCVVASFPQASVRYRMTIEIEADGKVHTGSSVVEVTYRLDPKWLPQSRHVQAWDHGEAVAIDLESRGVVFALLSGSVLPSDRGTDPAELIIELFGKVKRLGSLDRAALRDIRRFSGSREIDPASEHAPALVSFDDPKEPKSVRLVYTTQHTAMISKEPLRNILVDNFEALYGPGARLKRVHIEITQDLVTRGIEKHLPWLAEQKRGNLSGEKYRGGKPWALADQLSSYSFKR